MGGFMQDIDIENIDFEKLRSVLKDYFESGDIYKNPFSSADVLNIDNVNDYRLIDIALKNGFDLEDYQKNMTR